MTEIEWHSNLGGFFLSRNSLVVLQNFFRSVNFWTWTLFQKYKSRSNSNCYTIYIICTLYSNHKHIHMNHHSSLKCLRICVHRGICVRTSKVTITHCLTSMNNTIRRYGFSPRRKEKPWSYTPVISWGVLGRDRWKAKINRGTLNQSEQIIISPQGVWM